MKKNAYKGKFIVFEGLDGSGQSTQAKLLKAYLQRQGKKVLLTKEPTRWTAAGKKIKAVLEEKIKTDSLKLQELFVRDRAEHLKKEIIPALKKGKIVISDRYFLSTLAFGWVDVRLQKLIDMNKDFMLPDFIFWLRVKPEECLRRIKLRGEEIKLFEKLGKLQKVFKNYQKIRRIFKGIISVNGERPIDKIHKEIASVLKL